jgi:hypothetical protein
MKATEAAYMVFLGLTIIVYLNFEFSLTVERVVSSPAHINQTVNLDYWLFNFLSFVMSSKVNV